MTKKQTKALFTGGRDMSASTEVLNRLWREHGFTIVVHGAARGVDSDVDRWARNRLLDVRSYPADELFDRYGPIGGAMRNAKMLREERPDLVIAFPGGDGTKDMVSRAEEAGIEVIHA